MSKVWFITGSSRGLGRALVEYALAKGDQVVATARNPDTLQSLANQYDSTKLLRIALDVTNYDAAKTAVQQAVNKYGRIDIVINNAGYANVASVEDIDIKDFREQVDTNLLGVVYISKAVLPVLRQQGAGHIFQVSSVGGRLANPGLTAYQCAKWAVGGFSLGLADEVAPLGIKITVLEPGAISTDWAGDSMKVHPISEPYKQTVGQFSNLVRNMSGDGITKPAKVGPIIETLYLSHEPPVRMLVGPGTVDYVSQAAAAQADSDAKWKSLSESSA